MSGRAPGETIERLPSGRHGLPRQAVRQSQGGRIQRAIVQVVAEQSYPKTRVGDVIDVAGVSRRTFYEMFESREDCFLAAYDALLEDLSEDIARGAKAYPDGSWAERLTAAISALLNHLAERPAEARFAIVETLAAGPRALARREAALHKFSRFLDAGRAESSAEPPELTALSLAGGVDDLLHREIVCGTAARLPSRLPELVFWIALPFLGSDGAAVERERARDSMLGA